MKASARVTDRPVKSAMLSPPTVTARTSFFSRFPWQQAQGVALMQLSISSFWAWLELSR